MLWTRCIPLTGITAKSYVIQVNLSMVTSAPGKVNCTRYTLVVLEILFLIVGILLLSFGVWVVSVPATQHLIEISTEDLSLQQINRLCYFVFFTGCTLCIIALLGCFGSLDNNKCLLIFVTVFLLILLIAEVVVGAIGILYQDEISSKITKSLRYSLSAYNGDDDTDSNSVAWRETQKYFECCGINTDSGYENHTNVVVTTDDGASFNGSNWYRDLEDDNLREWPESCCDQKNGTADIALCYDNAKTTLNKVGCQISVFSFLQNHILAISTISLIVLLFQILAVFLTIRMILFIKSKKYLML